MIIPLLISGGKGYTQMSPEDLLAAGVPQADIDAAIASVRVDDIKAEASRRIFSVASANTQMNMTGAATRIAAINPSARTTAEAAEIADYNASLAWVAAMRANVLILAADPTIDYTDDANWPVAPPEVLALAARY